MSEALLKPKELDEEPEEPFLELVDEMLHEGKYDRCDIFLRDQGLHLFYRTGRLTPNGEIQVGVYRKALREMRLSPEEQESFEPWLELTRQQVLALGASSYPPAMSEIKRLRKADDPIVHIQDTLEALREAGYPNYGQEPYLNDIAANSHRLILSSVHGMARS